MNEISAHLVLAALLFGAAFGCRQPATRTIEPPKTDAAEVSPSMLNETRKTQILFANPDIDDKFSETMQVAVFDNGDADIVYVGCHLGACYGVTIDISRLEPVPVPHGYDGSYGVDFSGPFQKITTLSIPDLHGEAVLIPTAADIVTADDTHDGNRVFISSVRGVIK